MSPLKPWSPDKVEIFEKLQSLWEEQRDFERDRLAFAGGLQWKTVKGKDYLIHHFNDPAGEERRFDSKGPRSPKTEAFFKEFMAGRAAAEKTAERLDDQFLKQSALAKAMKIGRAPLVVGEIFR